MRRRCALAALIFIGMGRVTAQVQTNEVLCSDDRPGCAHYAILRSAEILGLQTSMEEIIAFLPIELNNGISFQQIRDTLVRLGLGADGFQSATAELLGMTPPLIAFVSGQPPHFVTVLRMNSSRVEYFDCFGNATSEPWSDFSAKFGGRVLQVSGDDKGGVLDAAFDTSGARIQFAQLCNDLGLIDDTSENVKYTFKFYNRGVEPLSVTGIKTDCTCVQSLVGKSTLAPGEESEIELVLDTRTKLAGFVENAYVASSDLVTPIVRLSMSGYVRSNEYVVTPRQIHGRILSDGTIRKEIFIRPRGTQPFEVAEVRCTIPSAITTVARLSAEDISARWPGVGGELRYDGAAVVIGFEYAADPPVAFEKLEGTITLKTAPPEPHVISIPVTILPPPARP